MGMAEVIEKKYFYRDSMRAAIKVAMFSVAVNVVLAIVLLLGIGKMKTEHVYFATNLHGGLIKLAPLKSALVTRQALLAWANKAILEMYAYDFVHYPEQLGAVEQYFTPKGHKGFVASLDSSGLLETVKKSRMVVSAVPLAAPTIDAEGEVNGIYTWRVMMPVNLIYQSSTERAERQKMIVVTIQRASQLEKEHGVAIAQVIEQSFKK